MSATSSRELSISCDYFDMDPHELAPRQIDYEEANGERNLAYLNNSPMQAAHDLEHCSFLCTELSEQVKEPFVDSRTLNTYWHRAIHLDARLERMRPTNTAEEEQRRRWTRPKQTTRQAKTNRLMKQAKAQYAPLRGERRPKREHPRNRPSERTKTNQ